MRRNRRRMKVQKFTNKQSDANDSLTASNLKKVNDVLKLIANTVIIYLQFTAK